MTDILDIQIDPRREATIAQQIKEQVAWLIASGQLTPGDHLPSVRELAGQLDINLNTVRSAYKKLEMDGLVETRQGWGTCVLSRHPSRLARTDSSLHSHTIGVILPALENPFYHAFLQGIEEVAHQGSDMLFVCSAHESPEEAKRYLAQLAAKKVDGVIIASLDFPMLLESKTETPKLPTLPIVTADWPEGTGYSVLIDLENAGYQATRHLLEHGHRRVGLITVNEDASNVRLINAGYERALQETAIEPDPSLVAAVGGFLMKDGVEGARRLLSIANPPAAIFTIADMLALGAMEAIKEKGLKIPGDIAIIGFNDIPFAGMVEPPLTTVTAPAREMGLEAMKMLQNLIAGKRPGRKKIILPTSLVIRQSCGLHKLS